MFVLPDYSERALTPELGGRFSDLRLWLRPMLKSDRDAVRAKAVSMDAGKPAFDWGAMLSETDALTVRLIVGWENTPTAYTPETAGKLRILADEYTGIDKPLPEASPPDAVPDKYRLFEYIVAFASDLGNFEKN